MSNGQICMEARKATTRKEPSRQSRSMREGQIILREKGRKYQGYGKFANFLGRDSPYLHPPSKARIELPGSLAVPETVQTLPWRVDCSFFFRPTPHKRPGRPRRGLKIPHSPPSWQLKNRVQFSSVEFTRFPSKKETRNSTKRTSPTPNSNEVRHKTTHITSQRRWLPRGEKLLTMLT